MAQTGTMAKRRSKASMKIAPPVPLTRSDRYAIVLLRAIEVDLADADFVTREDLIQLRVFAGVSTITRYHEVCLAVHILINKGLLVPLTRTNLALPGKAGRYVEGSSLAEDYKETITKLCMAYPRGQNFTIMDIVAEWKTDPHLTLNNKRTAVRNALKSLARKSVVKALDDFEYTVVR